jgi:hypothetical protein
VSEPVLTGGEGFTDAVTFAFADREAGFFGHARAGVADGPGQRARRAVRGARAGEPRGRGRLAIEANADWDELNLRG